MRALPPEAVASLRAVFAEDLPCRVEGLRSDDAVACRRAAHTVGSSAYVVGEPELARAARAVEALVDGGQPWRGPADALADRLARWAP